MRWSVAVLLLWLITAVCLRAATVTCAWDANTDGVTVGYQIRYGTAPGAYTSTVDVGPATTVAITTLAASTRYYFAAFAYNAAGDIGPPSNEVTLLTSGQEPACEPPLGDKSISIFPTKMTLTGSGGAGSKFRIDFQAASSSPIIRVALKANGNDLATMNGSNLNALAGIWANVPVPPASYNFSLSADNQYGCHRDQSTTFAIVVKP